MNLKDLFSKVLVNSGQFLIESDELELNQDLFALLVKKVLTTYNRYNPHSRQFNLSLDTRDFTFTNDTITMEGDLTGVPLRVTSAVPVRISGVYPFYLEEYRRGTNPALVQKTEYPISYRKPTLYVPVQGQYDIHAIYNHEIRIETIQGEKLYYLDTLDEDMDHLFIDLLTAHFLIGLGRSRRAFTLNDLPILSDANELVSDGKELEEKTLNILKEDASKWYLAWGGI